ncbi:Cystathionine gamma-synthase [Geodia barretti]|uniref:cystathionine gamma-lyase n=1 Tax=Geodia barretti TaxID=519541 RepID=A0AA35WZN1_GEOBA|nr:Cystathionine gamma-synthase [Geodia barretti]
MDLGLNETQQMLRNSAREFLQAECPDTYVREMEEDERGYTPEMWQKVAEQGWLGLIIPEQYGGVGLSYLDLSVLLEETGRALLPGPFFSTVVMGGMTIMDAGSEEQKQELLPQISEGQLIVTLALTEPSARWDAEGIQMTASQSGDGWVLNGVKLFVPNAHVSDTYVVAARTGDGERDITLFLVPRGTDGVSQTLLKTIASDRQSELVFENMPVDECANCGQYLIDDPVMERVENIIKDVDAGAELEIVRHHIDPESGAILAPIQPSTTFERSEDGEYPGGYIYSRSGNPNRRQLEDILATLEGGAACAAFSSGSAASAAVFQALESGDHVVTPNDCYHGTAALLRDVFARWGLQITFTDVTDSEQVQQAMQPNTRLVWVETPSNPMLKVTDIRRTAAIAHEAARSGVCDKHLGNADVSDLSDLARNAVVHSTTTYICQDTAM